MATEALKSTPIVNLDATPIVAMPTGEGAEGWLRTVNGHVAATSGATSPSTYRLVRVPTNAKVKHVLLTNAALGTSSAADIDVAFSDSATDGTQPSLAGGIVQVTGPTDNKMFGTAVAIAAAQKNQDQTFAGTFTTDMQNQPLWQALVNAGATQFSADPGGFFDIVLKTSATNFTSGDVAIEVQFVL